MARSIGNVILGIIIASMLLNVFTNVFMFFPWYLTLSYETMSAAVQSADYDYIPDDVIDRVETQLKSNQMFSGGSPEVMNYISIGPYESTLDGSGGIDSPEVQRNRIFDVTVQAAYPFRVHLGELADFTLPVTMPGGEPLSFTVKAVGVKYYKRN